MNNKIKQLTDMGFSREICEEALQISNGNVAQAANYLMQPRAQSEE